MLDLGSEVDLNFKSRNLTKRMKEFETESNVYSDEGDTDKNFGDMEYLIKFTSLGLLIDL
jgi:hypothetical protein